MSKKTSFPLRYNNLREFISALDRAGEMRTIADPVSAHLEISRYTDQESKSPEGGKALFFSRVDQADFPVVTNLFGSPRRICMALGVGHLDQLAERVRAYTDFDPPRSLREAMQALPLALDLTRFPSRLVGRKPAPCQSVVHIGDEVDLNRLPVLHCWPLDAGPFFTLPLVFTRSLESGRRNVGMYRLQVFDRCTTGMHWHIHKDGSHFFNEYRRAGKRMPVSVAVGADPATIYAATAPMPRGVDEMMLAGFIRRKPVRMVRCITNDLEVPAEADFVLEGYVDPGELRCEGPFGDHTGYYSLADNYPVFHVTALTHRPDPIYCATLVGRPPMEDCYLAKATERLFLPLVQAVFPEITDYCLPWEGVFHNIVFVAIDKAYPGHAQKIMNGLWGQGQMSFCKAIVVVDRQVDVQNPQAVLDTLMQYFDPCNDLTHSRGVLDVLDHSSPFPNFGNKIGLDLTERFHGEPPRQPVALPPLPDMDSMGELVMQVAQQVAGIVACQPLGPTVPGASCNRILGFNVAKAADRGGRDIAHELLAVEGLAPWNLMVLYDADIDLDDGSLLLWKLFNNVDPGRDVVFDGGRLVIDACRKGPMDGHEREWPEELRL